MRREHGILVTCHSNSPGTVKQSVPSQTGLLKAEQLFPGQRVSVDHFFCNPKGRLITSFGKEAESSKYCGGAIFVDHATGLCYVVLQSHLNSHETLEAKKKFEEFASSHGVVVQEYLTDNGSAFKNEDYAKHLEQFRQTIRHAGVGAHHANGLAERNIATRMAASRAIMHHQAIHWPDVADVELWPLSVLHANYVLNRIPHEESGQSPLEVFSRKLWPRSKFNEFHVWGCPCYVLNHALSDGKKLPRWKPRSGRHIYVGQSQDHSHAIPLVLNLDTGKITGQYHTVFDDWFQTVGTSDTHQINFDDDNWYRMFGMTEWQYVPDDDVVQHQVPLIEPSPQQREQLNQREQIEQSRAVLIRPNQFRLMQISKWNLNLNLLLGNDRFDNLARLPQLWK